MPLTDPLPLYVIGPPSEAKPKAAGAEASGGKLADGWVNMIVPVFNIVTGWFVAPKFAVPSRVSPNPVIVPLLMPTMPPGETNDWTEFEFGPAFGLVLVLASVFVVVVFTTAPPVTLSCCANAGADDANESAATDVIKAKRRLLASLPEDMQLKNGTPL